MISQPVLRVVRPLVLGAALCATGSAFAKDGAIRLLKDGAIRLHQESTVVVLKDGAIRLLRGYALRFFESR